MANFNELSGIKQWAAALGVAALLTGALYFTLFKSQREIVSGRRRDRETPRPDLLAE